jgi:tRNA G18 (ribose-2'-O)-methylase SpoU
MRGMSEFVHQRHKPPTVLTRPRELLVVCAPLRSNVNLARIVRTASCCGLNRMIACGHPKLDPEIARVDASQFRIDAHRSLPPVLDRLRADGYQLVGLEQATGSESLYDFRFQRRTALVIGNERQGLTSDLLERLHRVVEIPVYGLPYSYNVATATAMVLYEYCRQFPEG